MKQSNLFRLLAAIFISSIIISCSTSKRDTTKEINEIYTTDESAVAIEEVISACDISEYKSTAPPPPPAMSADRAVVEAHYGMKSSKILESPSVLHKDESAIKKPREVEKRSDGSHNQVQVQANLLTATEVNDFKKWDEWQKLLTTSFDPFKEIWKMAPERRFVARVSDKDQRPMVNVLVKLYDANNNLIWTARTDNTGTAQLWADLFIENNNQSRKSKAPYRIEFTRGNDKEVIANAQPYPQQTNVVKFNSTSKPSNNVDIFFIVDTTGSMSDELHYLQAELYNIIDKVKRNQANLNVRMGSLVYRDKGDDYLTRKSSFDSRIDKTVTFLKQQRADGGGDIPEAVDEALFQSIECENWQQEALSRIAFLVLDAPAHDDAVSVQRVKKQMKLAAEKGIRIVPVVASGMEQYGEYLMRCIALTTNGTYVALTDDSGIGNPHAKPTTDYYKVEKLNDLLIRLINDYTRIPATVR